MIYSSAEALSTSLLPEEIENNWLYPDIRRIREVSVVVTRGVIRAAQKDGMDRELALRNISDEQLDEYIRQRMYDPFTEHEKVDEQIKELASHLMNHETVSKTATESAETAVTSRPTTANGLPERGTETHGEALTAAAAA